jgi:competence protein ComEA
LGVFVLPGVGREERLVILLLVGLALAAGGLLWVRGLTPGARLAWEGEGAAPFGEAAGAAGAASAPTATTEPVDAWPTEPPAAPIAVHVAGAVLRPGVYVLPAESRVIDAVGAAGGSTPAADPNSVNLARRLTDGERLYIPTRAEVAKLGQSAAAAGWDGGGAGSGGGGPGSGTGYRKVNLNTATLAELDGLPGIGPTLATRIIQYRVQNGPFNALEELLNVSGIGGKKLADLRELVTIR